MDFPEIVGCSPPMLALRAQLAQIVSADASVLICGESGTGKELVARAIHRHGSRRSGPFVAINCAAMPAELLESQLFGFARGAFTGAAHAHEGLLAQAQGGVLLLDEIGDMPSTLQPKLLRALQERVARPLGGMAEIPFDVRVIATTNRDLNHDVEAGHFRADLFFRINVIQLELPPLRARGHDVLLLAEAALADQTARVSKVVEGLSSAAKEHLLCYTWPGNVRELHNCIERAVAFSRGRELGVGDLPLPQRDFHDWQQVQAGPPPMGLVTLAEVERRYIFYVLEAVGGNKKQAAEILGLDRKTLYRKLRSYCDR